MLNGFTLATGNLQVTSKHHFHIKISHPKVTSLFGIVHPIIARVQVCINAPIWPPLDRWRSRCTSVRPFSRAPPQFRAISCYERKPVPVPLRKQPLDLWPSLPGPRSGWPARGECLSDGRADGRGRVRRLGGGRCPPSRPRGTRERRRRVLRRAGTPAPSAMSRSEGELNEH